jgi:hypothetical protein
MQNNDHHWKRGGAAVGVAVLAALLVISLSQLPVPSAQPVDEISVTPSHVDPSLAGLSVGSDADPGGELPTF